MGRILDVWTGETVVHRGRRYFEVDGELVPAEGAVSGPPSLWQRVRRHFHPHFKPHRLVGHPEHGGVQGWEEALDTTVADGTQISNTVTETIVCPDFNIPAFYMAAGRILRLWAFGVNSNVVTTPGTLIMRVRWGGSGGTLLAASAAQGLDTTAHTNALWAMLVYIVCRTPGATGTFLTGGRFDIFNLLTTTAANLLPPLLGSAGTPGASGSAAVTVDTTAAKLLSITGQFSVATSPTNLTCQQRVIEALN